jgi:hypothetical protein
LGGEKTWLVLSRRTEVTAVLDLEELLRGLRPYRYVVFGLKGTRYPAPPGLTPSKDSHKFPDA